ncbi:MAG TPA: SUF system NifU family Fe-S cluster assembly protein [Miltoncostaeaceae bacterium]|jgi:nitrogen fixation protein NifU and related proteins|nr:SUF system NifU family Fe-S cluster assembly protein [Miltoncostaeaceae bacterium]
MGGLDDLYQELILDHYRRPRHRGHLDAPSVAVDHNNPMCGDQIHMELRIEDGRIAELGHTGEGCSISQSSASMLGEAVTGRPVDEAMALVEHFRQVMHSAEAPDEDRLGDAVALEGVARYPARVKCALLSWMALKDAVQTHRSTTEDPHGHR